MAEGRTVKDRLAERKARKICPLSFAAGSELLDYKCEQDLCQFWTGAYTIEGIWIADCAIVIGARKNAEGKIPV